MVVASGARYRRPAVPRLAEFEGRGVWYWASALEAKMCANAEVVLVGGGNSAGQAAVFLAQYAAKVHMLVRGAGLAASMSRYLIDRIDATAEHRAAAAHRDHAPRRRRCRQLASVTWRNGERRGGNATRSATCFVFVGADPETEWLRSCGVNSTRTASCSPVAAPTTAQARHVPASLESNVPGVFAVGDVRSGSVKRVGGAIGEGAAVVASQVSATLT